MFENLLKDLKFIDLAWLNSFDTSKLNEEELKNLYIEINNHNQQIYIETKKNINSYNIKKNSSEQEQEIKPITNEIINNNEDDDNEIDITFYKNQLSLCPSLEKINNYLPKRKNKDFNIIMNLLIIDILKEIKETNEIMATTYDIKEMCEWKKHLIEKKKLIDELVKHRDSIEDITIEEEQLSKNNVIYLQSTSNNFYAIQDIKDIDIDYYKSFEELLNSIIDGTFKNIKAFKENKKLLGLLEVKNFKTRIVFRQINLNTYIVVAMFMKKYQKNLQYNENLINRNSIFIANENNIKKEINNETYLKENDSITNYLLDEFEKRGIKNARNR